MKASIFSLAIALTSALVAASERRAPQLSVPAPAPTGPAELPGCATICTDRCAAAGLGRAKGGTCTTEKTECTCENGNAKRGQAEPASDLLVTPRQTTTKKDCISQCKDICSAQGQPNVVSAQCDADDNLVVPRDQACQDECKSICAAKGQPKDVCLTPELLESLVPREHADAVTKPASLHLSRYFGFTPSLTQVIVRCERVETLGSHGLEGGLPKHHRQQYNSCDRAHHNATSLIPFISENHLDDKPATKMLEKYDKERDDELVRKREERQQAAREREEWNQASAPCSPAKRAM
ncbi:hypothetical protein LX36DRAFT_670235 [Colletotrichum falcatum]|nr:hypothetical protein LX36DRAFT_670235 [Colletotrichum falcatum]